jgi:hypothetical protein
LVLQNYFVFLRSFTLLNCVKTLYQIALTVEIFGT